MSQWYSVPDENILGQLLDPNRKPRYFDHKWYTFVLYNIKMFGFLIAASEI